MSHEHNHSHDTDNIRLAFFLNVSFTIFEIIGGLMTNSVAILSDAVHDLGDSISLAMAWYLGSYSEKESNQTYTYGYRRYSLLGAFINAVVLIGGSLYVLSEAVPRLLEPEPFNTPGLILVSIIGILVNGAAVFRLRGGQSINAQVVSWHLLEDVIGWVAVFVVGIISLFVDLPILDPILSIGITLYILGNALNSLRKALRLFLQSTPSDIDVEKIETQLQAIEDVARTHHTHIWSLDGEHNVFTSHLVLKDNMTIARAEAVKAEVRQIIADLHLEHATIELEFSDSDCSMADETITTTDDTTQV